MRSYQAHASIGNIWLTEQNSGKFLSNYVIDIATRVLDHRITGTNYRVMGQISKVKSLNYRVMAQTSKVKRTLCKQYWDG